MGEATEPLRVDDQHEDAVPLLVVQRLMGTDATRQRSRKNFDHQTQAKTFVGLSAAHRQNRAGGISVKRVGVSRRPTLIVEQPAFGDRLSGDLFDANFALRRRAGTEVQNQMAAIMRDPDRQGVGAQSRCLATRRCHADRRSVRIHHQNRDQPPVGRRLTVLTQTTNVPRVQHRPQSLSMFASFL